MSYANELRITVGEEYDTEGAARADHYRIANMLNDALDSLLDADRDLYDRLCGFTATIHAVEVTDE